jgi:hypothetical protein
MDKLVRLSEFVDEVGINRHTLRIRMIRDFLSPKPKRYVGRIRLFSHKELHKWHAVHEDMKDVIFKHKTEFNGIQL